MKTLLSFGLVPYFVDLVFSTANMFSIIICILVCCIVGFGVEVLVVLRLIASF
jgi:hypothetical protein